VLHYLWRAVDQHGVVLDILVQERRNATAAKRFFKRLLAGLKYKPKRIVTDGLRSYGWRNARCCRRAAPDQPVPEQPGGELAPATGAGAPDAALQVTGAGPAVPVVARFIHGHFHPRRHLMSAAHYRSARHKRVPDLAAGDMRPART
jgi:putative transposase